MSAHHPFEKRLSRAVLSAALLASLGALSAPSLAQGEPGFAPGRILVMPRTGVPEAVLSKLLAQHGATQARRIGKSQLRLVQLSAGQSEASVVQRLQRHPLLKFAELDHKVTLTSQSNDPYAGSQWHLPVMKAQSAWDVVNGAGVTIAIIDTGVLPSHADLAANLVPGWNTYENSTATSDVQGHGTTTAGTAAAVLNNGVGVSGVAGGARIMPIRATDSTGQGYYSTIASGVTYAADHGARVASASFGTLFASSSVSSAGAYMKSKGGLLVVSAGNTGSNANSPATNSMIVVSATDSADNLAGWSTYGNMVSVAAPGVGILTTTSDGGYGSVSGTSYSAPATAGVVALIMSANPLLSAAEAEKVLYASALDLGSAGRDIYFGYGRVDADAAVRLARNSASTDTQKPTVAITSPANGTSASGLVAVDVSATDNVGVTRVDLLVNGVSVSSDAVAPFQFAWDSSATPDGSVTLTAVAYDAAGNAQASSGVAVAVSNRAPAPDTTPPQVVFTNPAEGANVSGTVQIRVSASDDSGAAALKQQLYIDGKLVASASGGSLNYPWNTRKTSKGSHTIKAVVVDAAGNTTTQSIGVQRVK